MSDYYEILGIKKNATIDEIKRAYRKKALECHPDKTGGDDTEFKKLNEAYETLFDSNKKHAYDNPQQNNPLNIFDMFFNQGNSGRNSNIKRSDHHYNINVTLKEIFSGVVKNIKVTVKENCLLCIETCKLCNGNGFRIELIQHGPFSIQNQVKCNCNNGTSSKNNSSCLECNGLCIINKEHILQINIPKCSNNGYSTIFKGLGEQIFKSGEEAGNLNVSISIKEDEIFTRRGNDLIYKTKIAFVDSIVGKSLIIPHFEQDLTIDTSLLGIINPNLSYITKGKGLNEQSDLIIVFEIEYPTNKLNYNQTRILNEAFNKVGM